MCVCLYVCDPPVGGGRVGHQQEVGCTVPQVIESMVTFPRLQGKGSKALRTKEEGGRAC